MALTPITYDVSEETALEAEVVNPQPAPSKTWHIDLDNGRIRGFIDDVAAIRQYIRKSLMTARNRYLIYDDTYGEELRDLIGQNLTPQLMDVEIPRLVREAIEGDDRIVAVTDVGVSRYSADSILITVTVEIVEGIFITEEVTI